MLKTAPSPKDYGDAFKATAGVLGITFIGCAVLAMVLVNKQSARLKSNCLAKHEA